MKCPYCGNNRIKVIDCGRNKKLEYMSRRRLCLNCFYRFNTREYYVPDNMDDKETNIYIRRKMAKEKI